MAKTRTRTSTRSAVIKAEGSSAWSNGWQDWFRGTAAVYVMDEGGPDIFLGDYDVEAMPESWPEELCAHRLRRIEQGMGARKLADTSLAQKVLIAFGPEVSPKQAITLLNRAIDSIKSTGLLIGRDAGGNLTWEEVNGGIRTD